jgi:hypothetical protein
MNRFFTRETGEYFSHMPGDCNQVSSRMSLWSTQVHCKYQGFRQTNEVQSLILGAYFGDRITDF